MAQPERRRGAAASFRVIRRQAGQAPPSATRPTARPAFVRKRRRPVGARKPSAEAFGSELSCMVDGGAVHSGRAAPVWGRLRNDDREDCRVGSGDSPDVACKGLPVTWPDWPRMGFRNAFYVPTSTVIRDSPTSECRVLRRPPDWPVAWQLLPCCRCGSGFHVGFTPSLHPVPPETCYDSSSPPSLSWRLRSRAG